MKPGLVNSAFGDENKGLAGLTFRIFKKLFGKTNEEGADTAVWLASREARPIQGAYYGDRKEIVCSPSARSLESAQRLWELSETKL